MSSVFVGLPVYNGAEFLEAALQSLLNQTYTDFRILISDNASTDATEEIGLRYAASDPRIIYHRHEVNMGAARNFNFCVNQAEGTYFKWMAHDDLCSPEYLERCVNGLEQDPGAVLFQAKVKCIDESGLVTQNYLKELNFNTLDAVDRFSRVIALNHSCVSVFGVIRLNVLKKTPAIAPFIGSDRALLAELALEGRLEYIPEELFLWRDHRNRSVRIKNRKKLLTWYNSGANSIIPSLYFQQFLAHHKAITRSPLSLGKKARAVYEVWKWIVTNYQLIFVDLKLLAGSLIRH